MALLAGTVIQSARVALPDPAGTLQPPGGQVQLVNVPGSTFFTGTYYLVITVRNPWGETTGTEQGPFSVDGVTANAIQVSSFSYPGATAMRVYLTQPDFGPGTESVYVDTPLTTVNQAVTVTISSPPVNAGLPPTRNNAYNPDTDGYALSAAQAFRWLNEGLTRMSKIVGGVLDYSGVGTTAGQPYYVLQEQWVDIPNVWYNGFWCKGSDPGFFYKRNPVLTSIIPAVAVSIFDDRTIFEVNYQPDRTAGTATLTSALDASGTSATVDNPMAFLLVNGFAQVGSEIVAYSGDTVTPLNGLIRRLGGTSAQSWPAGTPVLELNLFFQGRRILQLGLQPGDALKTLPIPADWESLLTEYLIAKYRSAEQSYEEQKARLDDFEKACRDWAVARTIQKHVQVGGNRYPLTVARTIAGGVILPAIFLVPWIAEMSYRHGGGAPWLPYMFMLCLILAQMKFVMWEKQKIRKLVNSVTYTPTHLKPIQKGAFSGFPNFVQSVCNLILSWSKSVPRMLVTNVSSSGLRTTVESENYLTTDWAATIRQFLMKFTNCLQTNVVACPEVKKLNKRCERHGLVGKLAAGNLAKG